MPQGPSGCVQSSTGAHPGRRPQVPPFHDPCSKNEDRTHRMTLQGCHRCRTGATDIPTSLNTAGQREGRGDMSVQAPGSKYTITCRQRTPGLLHKGWCCAGGSQAPVTEIDMLFLHLPNCTHCCCTDFICGLVCDHNEVFFISRPDPTTC